MSCQGSLRRFFFRRPYSRDFQRMPSYCWCEWGCRWKALSFVINHTKWNCRMVEDWFSSWCLAKSSFDSSWLATLKFEWANHFDPKRASLISPRGIFGIVQNELYPDSVTIPRGSGFVWVDIRDSSLISWVLLLSSPSPRTFTTLTKRLIVQSNFLCLPCCRTAYTHSLIDPLFSIHLNPAKNHSASPITILVPSFHPTSITQKRFTHPQAPLWPVNLTLLYGTLVEVAHTKKHLRIWVQILNIMDLLVVFLQPLPRDQYRSKRTNPRTSIPLASRRLVRKTPPWPSITCKPQNVLEEDWH